MSGIFQGLKALPEGALKTTEGISRFFEGAFLLGSTGFKYVQPVIRAAEKIAGGASPRRSARLSKKKVVSYKSMTSPKRKRKTKKV